MTKPWEKYGEPKEHPSAKYRKPDQTPYSKGLERVRAGLQGMTFGLADELGSGVAAGAVALTTDASFPDAYKEIMADLSSTRKQYRQDAPIESTAIEIAGGAATGMAGAGKLASTKLGQAAITNIPRWRLAAGLGAVEGGIYGAASADPGKRIEGGATGAAIGAIVAPAAGYGLDKGASTIGAITRWAKNKLGSTPKKEAIQAIRSALAAEGLDPDDAIAIYNRLGPSGMIADVGENFRALGRASIDTPGPAKAMARGALDSRQMGQQGRLLTAAEDATGKKADDLIGTVAAIAKRRAADADPAYTKAFASTPSIVDESLKKIIDRPSMKSAMRKAATIAGDMGDTFDPMSLKHLHYAKVALDKMLKDQKFPPHLMQLKKELLAAMDNASPEYGAARAAFAGESELIDAAMAGRTFLKTPPDELAALVKGMTPGEVDLFKMGAMAGIQDLFDNTRLTHDAAAKLIAQPATLKRLSSVFGDKASAEKFLQAAWREAEMGRTRAVIAGGSPTSQNLATQQWLGDAIQPETVSALTGDPLALVAAAAKELFAKKPLSPETLGEIGRMLMTQGMPEAEVRKILESPKTMQILQNLNREVLARGAAAGAAVPAFGLGE